MSDDDEMPEWGDAPMRTALLKNLRANNGENLHRLIESSALIPIQKIGREFASMP